MDQCQTLRAAVIGYGGAFNMGKSHAAWMRPAGIETVAVCDCDPERLAAAEADFPGIRTYLDYRDLAKDPEVDLVVNILPHNLHADATIACSEGGKHAVVEKPMCLTTAEADRMIAAAKRAGKVLSVFHNRRQDDDFLTIRKAIQEGFIGEVFQIETSIGGYEAPREWWRADKQASGGALFDWGAHFLDWILILVESKIAGVDGYAYTGYWQGGSIEDHARLTVRFENGCTADFQVSSLNSVPKPKWRILGTRGGISGDWGDAIQVTTEVKGRLARLDMRCLKGDWKLYYQNVADHILRGAELEVTAEQARRVIAVLEAAEESIRTGRTAAPRYA
jgi:predicted dehydrogenase